MFALDRAVGGDGGNWVRGGCCGTSMMGTAGSKNVNVAINSLPTQINDAPFSGLHSAGVCFAMGDGAVKFVNENIDIAVYKSPCTRSGEETNAFLR